MLNGMPPSGAIGGTVNVVPKRAGDESLTQVTAGLRVGCAVRWRRRSRPAPRDRTSSWECASTAPIVPARRPSNGTATRRRLRRWDWISAASISALSVDAGYQYQYIAGIVPLALVAANVPVPGAPRASGNFGQPWADAERQGSVRHRPGGIRSHGTHHGLCRVRPARQSYPVAERRQSNGHEHRRHDHAVRRSMLSQYRIVPVGRDRSPRPLRHRSHRSCLYSSARPCCRARSAPASSRARPMPSNLYDPTVVGAAEHPGRLRSNKASSVGSIRHCHRRYALGGREPRAALRRRPSPERHRQATSARSPVLQTSGYDQSALSPSVAVVVKPFWENVSFYGNFIQGLQQGAIVGATFANAGEVFRRTSPPSSKPA